MKHNLKLLLLAVLGLGLPLAASPVLAEGLELTSTGNSAGSDNQIIITTIQSTTTTQTNQTDISNQQTVNTDTGHNQVNGTTDSAAAVTTGDTTVNLQTANTNVNTNVVTDSCCGTNDTTVTVTGNGTNSQTIIDVNSDSTTYNQQNNQAVINNSQSVTANSGQNQVNNAANSTVTITTGDITVKEVIVNQNVNNSSITTSSGKGSVEIKISGNGTGSDNRVNINLDKNTFNLVSNLTELHNRQQIAAITGGNQANDATDTDITIATGDIAVGGLILNKNINSSIVDDPCCDNDNNDDNDGDNDDDDDQDGNGGPTDEDDPSNPTDSNTTPTSNSGIGGSSDNTHLASAGRVLGAVLPATGNLSYLIAFFFNILIFLFGTYLRLRAGRSPTLAFAA